MPKNPQGQWMCWRRRRQCNNSECRHREGDPDLKGKICQHCGQPLDEPNWACRHRFTKEEHDLWECPECGADRHCRMVVQNDGDACKYHGGESLKGIASPRFIHGEKSKYMPTSLLEDYENFKNHPNKLQVDDALATVRAMWWGEVKKLDDLGSPTAWITAKKVYERAKRALNRDDEQKFDIYFAELEEILTQGREQSSKRDEIRKLIEQERKLVDTQRQIYVDMGEFMTRAMVLGTIDHILKVTKDQMDDLEDGQERLYRIAEAVERLFGRLHSRKLALRSGSDGQGSGNPSPRRVGLDAEIRWDEVSTESGSEEVPF